MILMVNLSIRSRLVFISIGQVKYLSLNERKREMTRRRKRGEEKKKKKKNDGKKMNGCIEDVLRSTR